jgi:hypothetical protein
MAYSPTPDWAYDWARKVLEHEGKSDLPKITWIQSQKQRWSSGHFKGRRQWIHVSAGTDLTDQQYVLVHELAHWAIGGHYHHNKLFFQKLWDLFLLFDISVEYALKRDGAIYAGCTREALKRGIIDADRANEAYRYREQIKENKRKRAARSRRRTTKSRSAPKKPPIVQG